MSFAIELHACSKRYGDTAALDDLTLALPAGRITGVLGRNGAGKSTLLAVLAGYRRATAGTVRVDGTDPFEDGRVMGEVCLVRERGDYDDGSSVDEVLTFARDLRPRWDEAFADELADRFALPRTAKVGKLSHGKRSALSVTVGLASRAPLTMFDEPHLGMDVPSRYAFYEALLADYAERPRTILLSTHLIEEAASVFEDVVILDRGRLLVHDAADALRGRGAEVTGPADRVEAATAGLRVLGERRLGSTLAVVVDELDPERRARAAADGLEVGPVPLQDLFVHLTGAEADR